MMKYRKIDDLHSHGQQIFGLKPLFDSPDNMNEKLLELAKEALCEPVAWRYKWDKNLEWH